MKQLGLLLVLFLAAACGSTQMNEDDSSKEGETAMGNGWELSAEIDEREDTVDWSLTLQNTGEEPLRLFFRTSQQVEVVVTAEDGEELYRYSEGMMFTQVLTEKVIQGKEGHTWEGNIEKRKLSPGENKVRLSVTASEVNDEAVQEEEMTIHKTVAIE
ncbi:BsuPI-related putative proteinase inhibitor [Thalassobacillus sp. C254]|uniref:BsuPI-related putative proteinase inhibitor n=1 Tax=Thalassobacillus sp. C254 TaxID=1225341 RepID=UPI0006D29310|nr:BsuPI-related putative proteinase inhibitor [Thalassobacillus sp. C254]